MLSKDFLKLVFIAFLIATPLAWYFLNQWLEDFAYRINISWWLFPVAGVLTLIIALATISFQTIKASLANPVKSLRCNGQKVGFLLVVCFKWTKSRLIIFG